MREYKILKGWAIFIYITAPLLILLFGWLLIMPFVTGSENDLKTYWFFGPISIIMIALMVIGLMDTIKGKFVIDKYSLFTVSTFSNRNLRFNEIKGYRITDKYIFIESNDENKKNIKVSTYFANTNEIVDWLSENYTDLDKVQVIKEQREDKLRKAHKIAKVLNWTGSLIGAWTFFYPKPYEYAIIAAVVFPIICLIILKYFKGIIRIGERKDTAYPTIFWAIFAAGIGLCLRSLFDYNIFDYSKIWAPSILITMTYIVILTIGNKEFKFDKAKDYFKIIGFSIIIFGYGYGAVVTLNCMLDKTEPQIFKATMLNKRISTGKNTTYYIELTAWGQRKEVDEVSVSKNLYDRLEKNDNVNIYFRKGKYDIPWFEVTE